jgi:hypothetical protein
MLKVEMTRDITKQRMNLHVRKWFGKDSCKWLLFLLKYLSLKILMDLVLLGMVTCDINII